MTNYLSNELFQKVQKWAVSEEPISVPDPWYCPTRDIFIARLDSFLNQLKKEIGEDAYLLSAIVGEIGNNSFDHNLGSWKDAPGIFFAFEDKKKIVVLADRGQGILSTISHVKPDVTTHQKALEVAFTQIISGRSPEKRGNGLNFVLTVVREKKWTLTMYSGNALAEIISSADLTVGHSQVVVSGCLTVIEY